MTPNHVKPGRDVRLAELAGWRRHADQHRAIDTCGLTCPADRDPAIREERVTAAIARIAREQAKAATKCKRGGVKALKQHKARGPSRTARVMRRKASQE